MNTTTTFLAFCSLLASTAAFSSPSSMQTLPRTRISSQLKYAERDTPPQQQQQQEQEQASVLYDVESELPLRRKTTKKRTNTKQQQQGVLVPVVVLAKMLLGEQRLNKLRGKVIGYHTKVIGAFTKTATTTDFGIQTLTALFEHADTDRNGTICQAEFTAALHALGFGGFLKEKQVAALFARADKDQNGVVDLQEWRSEVPKILQVNLTKLAKHNGHAMGLLA